MNTEPLFVPVEYQQQIWRDTFSTKPFAPDFATRRQAFFDQVLRNEFYFRASKRAMLEVARLAAGGQPDEEIVHAAIAGFIEARKDCADFVMQAVLRILYQFNKDAQSSFSPALLSHARAAVLGFKYWPDEPGQDAMCTWTENHHILFSTSAYLAGQLYPDEVFTNSGRTGREMMAASRPRIERWLEMRFQSGFSEWLSHIYYDEDWAALLNLVDLAADKTLQDRARLVLDISLFDVALNSFQGVFGSTHGRSYAQNKKWAALEGTTDCAKLLFGTGTYTAYEFFSVALFAMSENYHMPRVLFDIANHVRATYINRQRMGHRTEDAAKWGLTYDDLEAAMVFYSNADFLHPKNAALTIKAFDAFDWWDHEFHNDFKSFRKILNILRKLRLLPLMARLLEKDISRNVRDEANIYTYRTPDYMLSTAQDYRPGYGGNQHHIWQATLGPNAVCFTTYPANSRRAGSSPNYWTGSGTLPRVAQVENVVIAVYKVSNSPLLTIPNKLSYTHAWLPRDQFDQVREQDGWVFAQKGNGYLALWSMKPYRWQANSGEDQNRELIAEGKKNVWICELGRSKDDGSFAEFIEKICSAEIRLKGLSVLYQSPSQGLLEFGWKGALRRNGHVVSLGNYPRYDNPYCQADFWAEKVTIQFQSKVLKLDWKTGERLEAEM